MIENETCFRLDNKIVEAFEIGNQRRATMRHRFKRGKTKRFLSLGERGINENTGRPKLAIKCGSVENRTAQFDARAGLRGGPLQFCKILFATAAVLCFGWADNS